MEQHVLVVDDDAHLRAGVMALLALEGIPAQEARNGAEALTLIEANPPAVLVLDLEMPTVGGREVVTQLNRAGIQIPTVLMSANQHLTQAAAELGVADWLPKPFSCLALVSLVQTLLGSV